MMRSCPVRMAVAFGVCFVVLAGSLGCREESAAVVPAVPTPETPEASFAEISRLVTRALDTDAGGVPSGFVASDSGSRSQFTVNNQVTSNLIPPAKAGDAYRGTITITSRSLYSIRHSDGAAKSSDDTKSDQAEGDGFSLLDDPAEDSGFGETNDGLISEAPTNPVESPTGSAKTVDRLANEDVRVFDLAYENGRWVLKTEPDPKMELAVKKAFDYALGMQR